MSGRLDFLTALFVPADRPERFVKAAAAGAGAIILDLEDAVAVAAKDAARAALDTSFTDLPVIVRINGADTPWHAGDLDAVSRIEPAAVMLPKAERPAIIADVARGLTKPLPIIALVETGRGMASARDIATAGPVARLAFGSIDYCADIGCNHTREALLTARSEIVLASRLAGRPAPLDGVTTAIDDAEVVKDDARYGRTLGFGGKMCIHPRQIQPARDGYLPSPDEIDWARRVVSASEGASRIEGVMVDEPVRLRAQALLRSLDRCI